MYPNFLTFSVQQSLIMSILLCYVLSFFFFEYIYYIINIFKRLLKKNVISLKFKYKYKIIFNNELIICILYQQIQQFFFLNCLIEKEKENNTIYKLQKDVRCCLVNFYYCSRSEAKNHQFYYNSYFFLLSLHGSTYTYYVHLNGNINFVLCFRNIKTIFFHKIRKTN